MTKRFIYEFEDNKTNRISYDYSPEADEKLQSAIQNDEAVIYLNRPGMLTLAKILIKIAQGDYEQGFHVHLRQDFNADLPECLSVVLSPDDTPANE